MKKKMFRVVLKYDLELTRSVFIRANDRLDAERRALRRYPTAIAVDHSFYPQN
jgi:hypothetical protein